MREALEQAIADAKLAKAPTQEVWDGQLVATTAGSLTYQFQLKTGWDVRENTKVVVLCDEDQIDARVIGQVDRVLTLVTQEAIPDEYLQHVTLREDASWLLAQQLRALLYLQETEGQMGAKVLGLLEVVSGVESITEQLGTFVPNAAQRQAIGHGLGSERTLVIGPGGTGKTATLSDLMCRYLCQGLSVLLVSHTNIATDNAFIRLIQAMQDSGKTDLLRLLEKDLVVRQGEPRHEALQTGAYRGLTVAAIAEARLANQASLREQLEQTYDDLCEQVEQNETLLDQREAEWPSRRAGLEEQIQAISSQREVHCARQAKQEKKDEQYFKEQARLRSNVEHELQSLQEQECQLGQRSQTHRERFEQYKQSWQVSTEELKAVQQMGRVKRIIFKWGYDEQAQERKIEQLHQSCMAEGTYVSTIEKELQVNQADQRKYQETLKQFHEQEQRRRDQTRRSVHVAAIEQCEQDIASWQETLQQEEQALAALKDQVIAQQRQLDLLDVQLADLDKKQAEERARIVAEAQLVATTATGVFVNSRLLQREFDVVVVDELSMISVISVLLVASRARMHFVGGGDPMQLSPVVKLVNEAKAPMAQEWLGKDLFTHLGVTISDATSGKKDCVFLDEQGRIHPIIAEPISRYVYLGMLKNRAETSHFPSCGPWPEYQMLLVDTSLSDARCQKPRQDKPRENPVHAQIVAILVSQILQGLSNGTGSVGVITPYRSQVNLISRELHQANLLDRVHVGTIHTVQGLEFEVVIFDTVEAPGTNPWPFTCNAVFDKHQMATAATRLLNVAHTRARYKLIYVAHVQHLHNYVSKNREHHLLIDLLDWAYRVGHVNVKKSSEPGGSFSFE